MTVLPQVLLIGAVVGVGVLHTIVPDHWVPITLLARQQGWSRRETVWTALKAGTGHVVSTLLIGLVVWIAGVAFATRFGNFVSVASSLALIGFGSWIAIGSLREMHAGAGHAHKHGEHHHGAAHGSEPEAGTTIATSSGTISLLIFEHEASPRFRVTGPDFGTIVAETIRDDGSRQAFPMTNLGSYWESAETVPEPHQFSVALTVSSSGRFETYETRFVDHDHDDGESLHEPVPKTSSRTALLLILGSSPMVEGIPAFFAAGKYGPGLIALMSVAFAISTIATYVALCVLSTAGLQRVNFGKFEAYGEVVSGAFIALVGVVFLIFPVL